MQSFVINNTCNIDISRPDKVRTSVICEMPLIKFRKAEEPWQVPEH